MPDIESCASCGVEVPPSQARSVRFALEHLNQDQIRTFKSTLNSETIPALLCAACFNATASVVNGALAVFSNSPIKTLDAPMGGVVE